MTPPVTAGFLFARDKTHDQSPQANVAVVLPLNRHIHSAVPPLLARLLSETAHLAEPGLHLPGW